jgi:hypothetical protein
MKNTGTNRIKKYRYYGIPVHGTQLYSLGMSYPKYTVVHPKDERHDKCFRYQDTNADSKLIT